MVSTDVDGNVLYVRFEPLRGLPSQIEDRIPLGLPVDVTAVHGIGRLLRILRAARVRIPCDPYKFAADAARVTQLTRRCIGAVVLLRVARRIERILRVWTESGVHRIRGVVDYEEVGDDLVVHRRGGQSVLRIPRRGLIRYSPSSTEYFEVQSIEVPHPFRLR